MRRMPTGGANLTRQVLTFQAPSSGVVTDTVKAI